MDPAEERRFAESATGRYFALLGDKAERGEALSPHERERLKEQEREEGPERLEKGRVGKP